MTSRHYFRYGITHPNEEFLPKREITVAERVKPLGYTTGHFGKGAWARSPTASRTDAAGARDAVLHASVGAGL